MCGSTWYRITTKLPVKVPLIPFTSSTIPISVSDAYDVIALSIGFRDDAIVATSMVIGFVTSKASSAIADS